MMKASQHFQVTITVAFNENNLLRDLLEKLTGLLSDESFGKYTVEESAVANVVIEGDTPDIDDLKNEIKLKFQKPWTHF